MVSLGDLRQAAVRGELYTILDACDEPRVPVKVRELAERAVPLYQGKAQEELWAIAPYLAQADAALVDWIASSLWAAPWGIFAIGECGLETLRTHLRRFLLVDAPDDEHWYFRFYDPRVLARFLPTCNAAQVSDFFGPVSALGWVDLNSYGVTVARQAWFGDTAPTAPRVHYRKVPQ